MNEDPSSTPPVVPAPTPGTIQPQPTVPVTPSMSPPPPPPPSASSATPTPPPTGEGHSWLKWLVGGTIVVLIVAVGLGVAARLTQSTSTTPVTVKHDVTLLRFASDTGPLNTLYPHPDTLDVDFQTQQQLYEGLVAFKDSTKIAPLLATQWTNPDDSTWIFDLQQGVKFHNGHILKAADVKFSLDNFKDTAFAGEFGTTIKSVTVMNDYQVKIITTGPDPLLLHRLAFLFIVDALGGKTPDAANGTGPYVIKPGTTPDQNHLDLVAFANYHGGHVYTRELQFTAYNDFAKMADAITANQADLAAYFVNHDYVAQLDKAKVTQVTEQTLDTFFLGMNINKKGSPLQKLAFRQALVAAIDPQVVLTAFGIAGKPTDQFVTRDIPGYNPAITITRPDLTKAKQLLTDAGYPKGATISISYGVVAQKLADSIKTQLAQIGVTVTLDSQPTGGALFKKISGGTADIYFEGYSPDLLDLSDTVINNFQNKNYDNADVDKLITQANQTLSETQHATLLQQAAQLLSDNAAAIPLYTRDRIYATAHPYVLHRDIANSRLGVYFWKVYLP